MILFNVSRLTIQQSVKVKDLQELPLPHEALQGGSPAFSQHLHPLEVQLERNMAKQRVYVSQCKSLSKVNETKIKASLINKIV